MKSSKDVFKNSLDKAFSTISLNASTLGDHMKYKQGFTEQSLEGGLADGSTLMDLAQKHSTSKGNIQDMYKTLKLELDKGIKVEMEHTKSRVKAKEIAMDHLFEDPEYYNKLRKSETKEATGSGSSGAFVGPVFGGDDAFWERSRSENPKLEEQRRKTMKAAKEVKKATNNEGNTFKVGDKAKTYDRKEDIKIKALWEKNGRVKAFYMIGNSGHEIDIDGLDPIKEQVEKVETKEATGSGSVGGYETPAMWAKSTKKKDWGPSRKTQIPGGGFVKIKKKCTKFPYCNQGDINNVKISKNESVKVAIKSVAKKLNIGENVIITILEHEYEKRSKRNK
jgi:hypothetical protein